MTILVTSGAAFVGSNFVFDGLAQGDEPIVNLDAFLGWHPGVSACARRRFPVLPVDRDENSVG